MDIKELNKKSLKITDKHVFFWGGWPSNWYKSEIESEGKKFATSEQYFMWRKADFFGDKKIAKEILNARNPKKAKELGRQVKNYNDNDWNEVRYGIMKTAVALKIFQNKELFHEILSDDYKGKIFVEASPVDKIWGIGMHMTDDGVDDEANWKGQNLLGKCITEIRDTLISGTEK